MNHTKLFEDVITSLAITTLIKVVVHRAILVLSNVVYDPSKELSTGLTDVGDAFVTKTGELVDHIGLKRLRAWWLQIEVRPHLCSSICR